MGEIIQNENSALLMARMSFIKPPVIGPGCAKKDRLGPFSKQTIDTYTKLFLFEASDQGKAYTLLTTNIQKFLEYKSRPAKKRQDFGFWNGPFQDVQMLKGIIFLLVINCMSP